MPHDIGSSRASGAVDTIALTSTDSPENTALQQGKTRNGRSVSSFSPAASLLRESSHKGQLPPHRALSSFKVATTKPQPTYNRAQEQNSAVPESKTSQPSPAQSRRAKSKLSNKFFAGASNRLTQKGYSKPEAFKLLQDWLKAPGVTQRSVKKLVIKAPYKDLGQQQSFDRVTADLLRMGYNTKSARKLAEDIVQKMDNQSPPHDVPAITTASAKPSSKTSTEKASAERPMTKETFVKKSLMPRLVKRLVKLGYEKQEARELVKGVINNLGGPEKCDIGQVRNIVRGMPEKEQTAPDKNLTREEALNILKLDSSASPEDIKKTYRKLALRHHPDKHVDADSRVQEEQRDIFEAIQRAYDQLTK